MSMLQNRQSDKNSPQKSSGPDTELGTVQGVQKMEMRISLTPSAITNMLGSVRSLWFLYTALQVRRLPKKAKALEKAIPSCTDTDSRGKCVAWKQYFTSLDVSTLLYLRGIIMN